MFNFRASLLITNRIFLSSKCIKYYFYVTNFQLLCWISVVVNDSLNDYSIIQYRNVYILLFHGKLKTENKNVYAFNFITLGILLTKNNFYNSVSNKHKIAPSLNWSLSELLGRILYAEWERSLSAVFWTEARRRSFEWHEFGG